MSRGASRYQRCFQCAEREVQCDIKLCILASHCAEIFTVNVFYDAQCPIYESCGHKKVVQKRKRTVEVKWTPEEEQKQTHRGYWEGG